MYLELLFFQGTLYKGFVAPHLVQRYIKRERESVGRLGWSALQKRGLGDIIIMAFYNTTR